MRLDQWLSEGLQSFKPTQVICNQALRHLSKKRIRSLSAENEFLKGSALGELYEAIIYEKILQLSIADNEYTLVRKWKDVSWENRAKLQLDQNGLLYDKTGSIVVRGNGQGLSEFDILMTKKHKEYAFMEIKNSAKNLKGLDIDLDYKKRLLNYLLQKPVQCGIVVPSPKIAKNSTIKKIKAISGNFCIVTDGLDGLNFIIKREDLPGHKYRKKTRKHTILLSEIKTKKMEYKRVHNSYRNKFFSALKSGQKAIIQDSYWMLKNVIIGNLNESAIKNILNEKEIIVKKERLTHDKFAQLFSKMVLVMSMPELRPVLYLRVISKQAFMKMGPSSMKAFEFERNVSQRYTPFFDWMDSVNFEIGSEVTKRVMNICLNESVVGKRKKLGQKENLI